MGKDITLETVEEKKTSTKHFPKQSTINLIKQFARAYSYNAMLQKGLGGFTAN